jgi:hypothetical protein
MSARSWTNVCMRYTAEGVDHNDLNRQIRDRIIRSGRFMASSSEIGDDVILRPVISNPAVTEETLRHFVAETIQHGDDIIRGIPFSGEI